MSWKNWKAKGDDWSRIYAGIKATLDQFAERHHMELSPWHWDEPSLTLSWESEAFMRNIRIRIEGEHGEYELAFSGAAWRDVLQDDERIRKYNDQPELYRLYIGSPEYAEGYSGKVEYILRESAKKIDSLSETTGEAKLPTRSAV